MPFWLSILISLAIKFGVPWLLKRIPGLPPEIRDIIERLVGELAKHKEEKKAIVADAKKQMHAVCSGVGCPTDIKAD